MERRTTRPCSLHRGCSTPRCRGSVPRLRTPHRPLWSLRRRHPPYRRRPASSGYPLRIPPNTEKKKKEPLPVSLLPRRRVPHERGTHLTPLRGEPGVLAGHRLVAGSRRFRTSVGVAELFRMDVALGRGALDLPRFHLQSALVLALISIWIHSFSYNWINFHLNSKLINLRRTSRKWSSRHHRRVDWCSSQSALAEDRCTQCHSRLQ